MLALLMIGVALVVIARGFGCSPRRVPAAWSTFLAVWAAGCGAMAAVEAVRAGSLGVRAEAIVVAILFAAEVRRIVRAWRLIPARDSVTR